MSFVERDITIIDIPNTAVNKGDVLPGNPNSAMDELAAAGLTIVNVETFQAPEAQEIQSDTETPDIFSKFPLTDSEISSFNIIFGNQPNTPVPTATPTENPTGNGFFGLPEATPGSPYDSIMNANINYHIGGAPEGQIWQFKDVHNYTDLLNTVGAEKLKFVYLPTSQPNSISVMAQLLQPADITIQASASEEGPITAEGNRTYLENTLFIFNPQLRTIAIVEPTADLTPAILLPSSNIETELENRTGLSISTGTLLATTLDTQGNIVGLITNKQAGFFSPLPVSSGEILYRSIVRPVETGNLSLSDIQLRENRINNYVPEEISQNPEWTINPINLAYERVDPQTGVIHRFRQGMGTVRINGNYLEDDLRKGETVETGRYSETYQGKSLTIIFEGEANEAHRNAAYPGVAFHEQVMNNTAEAAQARQNFIQKIIQYYPSLWRDSENVTLVVVILPDDMSQQNINRYNSGGVSPNLRNAVATGHKFYGKGGYEILLSPYRGPNFAGSAIFGFAYELQALTGQNTHINDAFNQRWQDIALSVADPIGLENISNPEHGFPWTISQANSNQLNKSATKQSRKDRLNISNMVNNVYLEKIGAFRFQGHSQSIPTDFTNTKPTVKRNKHK